MLFKSFILPIYTVNQGVDIFPRKWEYSPPRPPFRLFFREYTKLLGRVIGLLFQGITLFYTPVYYIYRKMITVERWE